MASDTTAGLAKWTDTEKLALLISVINTTNPNPNWANVNIPQGRTIRACKQIFYLLKKEAAAHPMTDGAAIPASKKRGEGRKRKNAGRKVASSPVDDDEETPKKKKKVKVEVKDEDEDEKYGFGGETESQEDDGLAA